MFFLPCLYLLYFYIQSKKTHNRWSCPSLPRMPFPPDLCSPARWAHPPRPRRGFPVPVPGRAHALLLLLPQLPSKHLFACQQVPQERRLLFSISGCSCLLMGEWTAGLCPSELQGKKIQSMKQTATVLHHCHSAISWVISLMLASSVWKVIMLSQGREAQGRRREKAIMWFELMGQCMWLAVSIPLFNALCSLIGLVDSLIRWISFLSLVLFL